MTIVCHCKKCGCEFEYERTAPHAKPKYCRDCKRTIQSERRKAWHDSHKEYDREYARKWRAANPDYFAVYYGRKGIKRISANRVAPSTFVCTECSREFEHEFRGVRPRFCPACIRAHNRARGKAWLKAHPEVERVMRRRKHWKQRAREYFDADYYAKRRKRDRERSVKYRDRTIFAKKPRKLRGGYIIRSRAEQSQIGADVGMSWISVRRGYSRTPRIARRRTQRNFSLNGKREGESHDD